MISDKAVFGQQKDTVVLWVDLWGVSSLLANLKKENDLLVQADIAHRIAAFSSRLAVTAKTYSNVEVIQASDGAFIISEDPNLIIEVTINLFQMMQVHTQDKFRVQPLRGGISQGLVEIASNKVELDKIKNFSYFPYTGEGMAKAHKIEACKHKKGIRLFITESVKNRLSVDNLKRVSSVSEPGGVSILNEDPENYYEMTWMDDNFLSASYEGKTIEEQITEIEEHAENQDDKYLSFLADSLVENMNMVKKKTSCNLKSGTTSKTSFKFNQLFFGSVYITLLGFFYLYFMFYFKDMPDVILIGGLLILGTSNRQMLWFHPDMLRVYKENEYPQIKNKIYYFVWPIVIVLLLFPLKEIILGLFQSPPSLSLEGTLLPTGPLKPIDSFKMILPMFVGVVLGYVGYLLNRFLQVNIRSVFQPLRKLSGKYIRPIFSVFVLYLLVSCIYTVFYRLSQMANKEAFDGAGSDLDMFYFSIVTLTSLGYGDIQPKTDIVKMLAISEIIVGQVIIVGIFAMIIMALTNKEDS